MLESARIKALNRFIDRPLFGSMIIKADHRLGFATIGLTVQPFWMLRGLVSTNSDIDSCERQSGIFTAKTYKGARFV